MSLLGVCLGFPLPDGLDKADLLALSALGGIGLTVALFVSNEAFIEPELKGQAKMGAVLSVVAGAMALCVHRVLKRKSENGCTIVVQHFDGDDAESSQTNTNTSYSVTNVG